MISTGCDYLTISQVLETLMYLKHISTQAAQSANIHNPFSGPFNPITDTGRHRFCIGPDFISQCLGFTARYFLFDSKLGVMDDGTFPRFQQTKID